MDDVLLQNALKLLMEIEENAATYLDLLDVEKPNKTLPHNERLTEVANVNEAYLAVLMAIQEVQGFNPNFANDSIANLDNAELNISSAIAFLESNHEKIAHLLRYFPSIIIDLGRLITMTENKKYEVIALLDPTDTAEGTGTTDATVGLLQEALIVLVQIEDDADSYRSLLEAEKLKLPHLHRSLREVTNFDQAYMAVPNAQLAVTNFKSDSANVDSIASLEVAERNLLDAIAFLESNPQNVADLLEYYPVILINLDTLNSVTRSKQDEVEAILRQLTRSTAVFGDPTISTTANTTAGVVTRSTAVIGDPTISSTANHAPVTDTQPTVASTVTNMPVTNPQTTPSNGGDSNQLTNLQEALLFLDLLQAQTNQYATLLYDQIGGETLIFGGRQDEDGVDKAHEAVEIADKSVTSLNVDSVTESMIAELSNAFREMESANVFLAENERNVEYLLSKYDTVIEEVEALKELLGEKTEDVESKIEDITSQPIEIETKVDDDHNLIVALTVVVSICLGLLMALFGALILIIKRSSKNAKKVEAFYQPPLLAYDNGNRIRVLVYSHT